MGSSAQQLHLKSKTDGYIIISPLSDILKKQIYSIQNSLADKFGESSFWFPKQEQLHITFAHIISPDAIYDKDPSTIYKNLSSVVNETLSQIASEYLITSANFGAVESHPSAIIIRGHDSGNYKLSRQKFTGSVALPPQTRRPPKIIHSTIARFKKELDKHDLKNLTDGINFSLDEDISELLLIHETKIYAQEYKIIKRFPG